MAVPNILIDTTFTGKDISTAASVYEYTVAATGSLRIQVRLAAVAGGGDYVAYLTLNDGDGQTDDPILPKTTLTAAAGETAFWFSSITIDAIAGDVINVFVDGLAGDTNEAGSIRIFSDAALQPTTAGRTLDVSSGGEAGVDWANVGTPTTTVGLSGTTVKAVTDGVALADDAITKNKFDESTAWPLLAADTAATQIARVGADADTLETLSDQIDGAGISLTAQQMRDANKLAPTAGAPAAGSVDEHLDNIPTAQTRWTH